jgi:hypothetical protein
MKRVVVLSLCVLGVIAVTLFASGEFAHIQKKRKAASDIRRCDERLAGLRRDLPVGTSRDVAMAYLHAHGDPVAEFGGEPDSLSVDLGRIQSVVWFCGFWEDYAILTFGTDASDRTLKTISKREIGECL